MDEKVEKSKGLGHLRFDEIRINPLTIISAGFLVVSPFLTWITLVTLVIVQGLLITGFAVQSNLWDISNSHAGMPLSASVASSSFFSAILVISGGLSSLRKKRTGLLAATVGLALFLAFSFPLFGKSESGATTAYISPGIGFFLALVGIIIGYVSSSPHLAEKYSFRFLASRIRKQKGLMIAGLFISIVSIALDGLNHGALGQLPDFLGSQSSLEMTLHLGFYLCIGILAVSAGIIGFQRKVENDLIFWISCLLIIAAVSFIICDALFHTLKGGGIQKFIGHNPTEIILHMSTYYGMAFITVSRFFLMRQRSIS